MSDREEAATGPDPAEEMGRATERLRAQAWKISAWPTPDTDGTTSEQLGARSA